MAGVGLIPSILGGFAGESALYGIYLVMFIASMYAMFFRPRSLRSCRAATRPTPNRTILAASLVLFSSISSHWIVDVARLFKAFVYKVENPGPLLYYANLADPLEVAKTGMVVFQLIVGDFTIVYRLWIIWNQNKAICVFPLFTLVGLTVTSVGITYQFTTLKIGVDVFATECGRWITSCCVLTLATNLYCTALISYRIWSINRNMKLVGASDLMSVIVIVVESAAIYTASMFAFMVAYLTKSNLQFPFLDMLSPIVGISFSFIIIRVSLGVSYRGMQTTQTATLPFTGTPSSSSRTGICATNSQPSYTMKPISVNLQPDVGHDHMESRSDEEDIVKTTEDVSDAEMEPGV